MPVEFDVYVRPRSRPSTNDEWFDGRPVVRVAASPVDGQANRAVVATVAERLGVARSSLHVAHGHQSRRKRLVLDDDRPEVLSRLQAWRLGGPSAPPAG